MTVLPFTKYFRCFLAVFLYESVGEGFILWKGYYFWFNSFSILILEINPIGVDYLWLYPILCYLGDALLLYEAIF